MSTETTTSLTISRVIPAAVARVYRAWTEPEQMKQWACPEGGTVEQVEADVTVGGRYRIRMRTADDAVHTAHGVYREVTPPSRLVYTWDWEEDDHQVGETIVTVEFKAAGDATEVVLTHELFPNADATSAHEEGWTSCFNRLERMF